MSKKQFETTLAPRHRLRSTFETERGKVLHWAIQLEWLESRSKIRNHGRVGNDGIFDLEPAEGWVWIARYDTAGGQPHRDRHLIAAHEPTQLPTHPGDAARLATHDLKTNAVAYTEAYRAAKAARRSK